MRNLKGKFIVIDGTDGSGKATQTELLAWRLRRAGFDAALADFPQYGSKSAGAVEEYLNGKYGSAEAVGPYRASILYAIDRYDASFKILDWLRAGKIVLANRYVTANLAHQGGKIDNPLERKHFYQWLNKLEYGLFAIPRPDLTIILHVESALAQSLVDRKAARTYLGGRKRDIHEDDLEHLKRAEKIFLEIAKTEAGCIMIECIKDGQILSQDTINNLVWQEIKKLLGRSSPPASWQTGNTIKTDNMNDSDRILRVKRLVSDAKLPTKNDNHDGLDLYSLENITLMPGEKITVSTGLSLRIPSGYIGLVGNNHRLAGEDIEVGTKMIDNRFRDEIKIELTNLSGRIQRLSAGQKVARLLIQKT